MLLSGCAAKPEASDIPKGMKIFSNEYVDYTAYIPEAWIVNEPTATPYAYVGSQDASSINIVAQSLSNEQIEAGLEAYWEEYAESFKQNMPDFESVSEVTEGFLLDKTAASQYIYTGTVSGVKYQFQQTVCMHGGYVYIITYTSTPELFNEHIEDVEQVINTFKFNG